MAVESVSVKGASDSTETEGRTREGRLMDSPGRTQCLFHNRDRKNHI